MAVSRGQRIAIIGGVVLLAVVGGAAWAVVHYHLFDSGSSTPLTVEEARDRYRESTSTTTQAVAATTEVTQAVQAAAPPPSAVATPPSTTAAPAVAQLPAVGVYTYTTTGGDAIDALTGAHHDYPATTTITVTASGCGVLQRWDVLKERWEEWQRCVDGNSISEPARTTFDEFFGQGQTDAYVCSGAGRPVDGADGTAWARTCVEGDEQDVYAGVIVGTETLQVGDTAVSTTHVRVSIVTTTPGDTQTVDTWYQQGTDLVIAQTFTSATTNPTEVGPVHYTENYEIHLDSLVPLT